jgi:hypothetical protein
MREVDHVGEPEFIEKARRLFRLLFFPFLYLFVYFLGFCNAVGTTNGFFHVGVQALQNRNQLAVSETKIRVYLTHSLSAPEYSKRAPMNILSRNLAIITVSLNDIYQKQSRAQPNARTRFESNDSYGYYVLDTGHGLRSAYRELMEIP